MKYIDKYKSMGIELKNSNEITVEDLIFEYLISTLKDTIRTYDFFVAWDKVINNISKIEISLNVLNSLIGKTDIENKFKELIREYPEIVPTIPFLIAVRTKTIKVADIRGDIEYSFKEKKSYTDDEIEKIVFFAKKSGILKLFEDRTLKNLVDYAVGVEVGLDTNARKNRSGTAMESLIEIYIKEICEKNGYKYIAQATASRIKKEFGKDVSTDKSKRQFDFAIDTGNMLCVMEVNYYGSGGSKLKSVAGEFSGLFNLVKNETTCFIWITDGEGWLTAKKPLKEAFTAIDFIMNIDMIKQGLLEEILIKEL